MQQLRKKVLKYIREQKLFSPGDTIVVAFSGGIDSMALLDILAHLPGFPLRLVVAHLNHLLRGEESAADEHFARSVAGDYALDLEISRVDVAALAREQGLSLEEMGREVRRAFFMDVAGKHAATAVALGHHRDDQAETVLLRLLRGAAGSGLTGMQPKGGGTNLVRPLLCLGRPELETYLRQGSLQWREDSSNADTKFLRNRIRHELLPLLKSYNSGITSLLNRTAAALAADEELLAAITDRAFARMVSACPAGVSLDLAPLRNEPQALRKRLYRQALTVVRGDLRRISARHLADLDALALAKKGSGTLSLPFGVIVVREYGEMIFTTEPQTVASETTEMAVASCGSFFLPSGRNISVERLAELPPDWQTAGENSLFIDAKQHPFPWTVRAVKAGDRFTPLGMRGRKKLQDLFVDKKIPAGERSAIPLLLCRGEIIWVCGVQAAEQVRLGGKPEELLRVRVE